MVLNLLITKSMLDLQPATVASPKYSEPGSVSQEAAQRSFPPNCTVINFHLDSHSSTCLMPAISLSAWSGGPERRAGCCCQGCRQPGQDCTERSCWQARSV